MGKSIPEQNENSSQQQEKPELPITNTSTPTIQQQPQQSLQKIKQKRQRGVITPAPFLLKLYEILHKPEYSEIVTWNENGDAFIILNLYAFTEKVLPMYFRSKNFDSFLRQLNMYYFQHKHSLNNQRQFKHKFFMRNQKQLLVLIKRKSQHSNSNKSENNNNNSNNNNHSNNNNNNNSQNNNNNSNNNSTLVKQEQQGNNDNKCAPIQSISTDDKLGSLEGLDPSSALLGNFAANLNVFNQQQQKQENNSSQESDPESENNLNNFENFSGINSLQQQQQQQFQEVWNNFNNNFMAKNPFLPNNLLNNNNGNSAANNSMMNFILAQTQSQNNSNNSNSNNKMKQSFQQKQFFGFWKEIKHQNQLLNTRIENNEKALNKILELQLSQQQKKQEQQDQLQQQDEVEQDNKIEIEQQKGQEQQQENPENNDDKIEIANIKSEEVKKIDITPGSSKNVSTASSSNGLSENQQQQQVNSQVLPSVQEINSRNNIDDIIINEDNILNNLSQISSQIGEDWVKNNKKLSEQEKQIEKIINSNAEYQNLMDNNNIVKNNNNFNPEELLNSQKEFWKSFLDKDLGGFSNNNLQQQQQQQQMPFGTPNLFENPAFLSALNANNNNNNGNVEQFQSLFGMNNGDMGGLGLNMGGLMGLNCGMLGNNMKQGSSMLGKQSSDISSGSQNGFKPVLLIKQE